MAPIRTAGIAIATQPNAARKDRVRATVGVRAAKTRWKYTFDNKHGENVNMSHTYEIKICQRYIA